MEKAFSEFIGMFNVNKGECITDCIGSREDVEILARELNHKYPEYNRNFLINAYVLFMRGFDYGYQAGITAEERSIEL